MKIVNRDEFLKMPPGTLYSRAGYLPHAKYSFGELELKRDSFENDWWFIPLNDVASGADYISRLYMIDKMYGGEDIDNPEYSQMRDGLYNENEKFLVWSEQDKQQLIDILSC